MDHLEEEPFAQVLQRLRKRARLTQQALAERIGAHRSTVSFWERGEYMPETLTTVLEIARALRLGEDEKRLLVEARFGTASILPWHNLPEPNPYFTGREAILETLHRALTAGSPVALIQTQAISGLGGIGKTQLALAYAYRYHEHYHDILWALAESRETLVASYMTFAEQLRLGPRAEQEQQRVVEAVKRWLREHRGWLLILDNIEDLQLVRDFVPTPRQGAVVLTTRRAETGPLARALILETLSDAEGTLFLLRRAGLLPVEAALEDAASGMREVASAIVQKLGGLPLALDQAGAYLAETRCGLFDYLNLLQQQRLVLLHRRGTVPGDHPEPVTTTFALAFERVQQKSQAAGELLRLCAYLAPEAIPLDLLSQATVDLGPVLTPVVAQPFALDAALEILQAYSLVRRDAEQGTLSLHRLVQAVQQETAPDDEQRLWAELELRLVSAAFPTPEVANWERCQHLLPHALVCVEQIARWNFSFPEAASLLHQVGHYLHERAAYEQARPLLQRALSMREHLLGAAHPDVAQTLETLAVLSWAQGQYEQALPFAERAILISEQALDPIHPDVAAKLNTLGMIHCDLGNYAQARPLLQRALAIREQALGPVHPDVAQSLNNLAILSYQQGKYPEALPLYQRALAIWEQALGLNHPEVATSLNNLANLYRNQGQYQQALPLLQRSLAIREQALGPTHPDVAWSLNGLANLHRAQGHYTEALSLLQRSLTILEHSLGPAHPEVAWTLNTLTDVYHAQAHYIEALPLAERALAIREQALGPHHSDVAESLNALARLYEAQGQLTQALSFYRRALAILEQGLPDHPTTIATREREAALLQQVERAETASG